MTELESFKETIDEKFRGVYSRIDANNETTHILLKQILEQTQKTNGRVTKLESEMTESKIKEATHFQSCPVQKRLDEINDELLEYRMLKKYPTIVQWLIVGTVAVACLALYSIIF